MWFNTIKLIQKLKPVWSYFSKKEAFLAISEVLNFKISRGSMPPDPPRLAPHFKIASAAAAISNLVADKLNKILTKSLRWSNGLLLVLRVITQST